MHARVFVFLQFSTHSYLMMIIVNLFFSYAVLEEIFKQNKKRKKVEQDKFQVVFLVCLFTYGISISF